MPELKTRIAKIEGEIANAYERWEVLDAFSRSTATSANLSPDRK
jgi:hypothetical protein